MNNTLIYFWLSSIMFLIYMFEMKEKNIRILACSNFQDQVCKLIMSYYLFVVSILNNFLIFSHCYFNIFGLYKYLF